MEEYSIIYGTAWKEERTAELVELALASGFTAIDTAGQPRHYQEDLVGAGLANAFKAGIGREQLFIQTKFTPVNGQDHRLPYDPQAPLAEQVAQSFTASLANLGVDFIDSCLLHGPYHHPNLGSEDWEVWSALESLQLEGKVGAIGISNVNVWQLSALLERAKVRPAAVQNRCYASRGWDKDVRELCTSEGISYQGFSLLTANPQVVSAAGTRQIAERHNKTPQQVIYRFSQQIGITPLCGTTNVQHMQQALAAADFDLSKEEVAALLA